MKILQQAVKIEVPAFSVIDEDGEEHEFSFSILFKRAKKKIKSKRARQIMRDFREAKKLGELLESDDVSDAEIDKAEERIAELDQSHEKLLMDDILGWSDLIDLDGSEFKFNDKNKRMILDHEPFYNAILGVYSLSHGGVINDAENEADLKN